MTAYFTHYEGAINYLYIGSSAIIVQHLRTSLLFVGVALKKVTGYACMLY